jgi:hypothetical protein
MEIDMYVQAVSDDLAGIAAVGDESTARAAELLAAALQSSLGRRLEEALAQAALELSAQLEHGHVEVRIAGGDPQLVYVAEDEPPPPAVADGANSARLTLRLPESLKSRIEATAASSGMSVNTWILQALTRLLEPRPAARAGHRLSGYGRG